MLSPSDGEQSDARGAHVAPAAPRKPPERRAFLAGEAGMKLMDGYLSENRTVGAMYTQPRAHFEVLYGSFGVITNRTG